MTPVSVTTSAKFTQERRAQPQEALSDGVERGRVLEKRGESAAFSAHLTGRRHAAELPAERFGLLGAEWVYGEGCCGVLCVCVGLV